MWLALAGGCTARGGASRCTCLQIRTAARGGRGGARRSGALRWGAGAKVAVVGVRGAGPGPGGWRRIAKVGARLVVVAGAYTRPLSAQRKHMLWETLVA